MAASIENHEESDAAGMLENSQTPEQKGGSVRDAGSAPSGKRWPGWPGESVFRILVPSQKIGSLIGRKGEFIKKMCEESKARIKILDGPPGVPERAVMISAKEEQEASIPPAVDGLLRVHKRTVDGLNDTENAQLTGPVSTRLLVAGAQAGSLIGRQGSTIKSIQDGSNCTVRVLGIEELPTFALQDDRVVEIQGEPAGVHKAIELIASHLRKFLVDRTVLPLFEMRMPMPATPHPHLEPPPNMPPLHQPWSHPQGPPNASGPRFPPPLPHDNYFPSSEFPLDKQSHQNVPMYGREIPPVGAHPSANLPPPSQPMVTQHMQIPLSYADAVIGTSGASISYIRRASGATITIQETRGVPGEMTVEINGSATQVQTAQQLIQNFMAEASAPPPSQPPHLETGYSSSYPSHGSMYGASASTGHPSGNGGYASMYGGNYGY